MPLTLYSEPYCPTGNIGENLKKLLGAPTTDPLQTAIREALQNIADAARLGCGPRVLIRLRRLSAEQRRTLREEVFHEMPPEEESAAALRRFLNDPNAFVLEICDFDTVGLGGPTRADEMPTGTRCTDFVDFLLNVGSPRDTVHGGGTYGFGKTALYRVSRCTTIIVDTFPSDPEFRQQRLMACHLGRSFARRSNRKEKKFTGRHWWGRPIGGGTGGVEPLTGDQARNLAQQLGFPGRSKTSTGTSIMILDFARPAGDGEQDEPEDPSVTGNRIVETILWNFWPRMMESTPPERRFTVDVEVEGVRLRMPAPEQTPPLDLFSIAMDKVRSGDGCVEIRSQRPAKRLGTLAIQKGPRSKRCPLVGNHSVFPERAHHIALMRPVELVVKYLEGPAIPDESLEWCGVFRASDEEEVERAFAESEPPAHDDWIPSNLQNRHQKTFVNVALRRIGEEAQRVVNANGGPKPPPGLATPLAQVADRLGRFLDHVTGDGPGIPPPRRGGQPHGGRPAPDGSVRPAFRRLEEYQGRVVAVFEVRVPDAVSLRGKVLTADAAVVVDGRSETPDPELMAPPRVLCFRRIGTGQILASGNSLRAEGRGENVEVLVEMPPDCAVKLETRLAEEEKNG
ncbi:MAG: hypothetical protein RMJ35_00375 [Phycisphaerales bacterium]|nr:hypothetical protein [Phycisphaerales bacterium]